MNQHFLRTAITSLLLLSTFASYSQDISQQRKAVIDTLIRLVETRYVYPDIAQNDGLY